MDYLIYDGIRLVYGLSRAFSFHLEKGDGILLYYTDLKAPKAHLAAYADFHRKLTFLDRDYTAGAKCRYQPYCSMASRDPKRNIE
ncbi:MAG: hypothetical protein LBU32_32895 [Clostridiales bacterium]|nr:hypothetical protein [Clostridiales bacterium]